MANFGLSQLTVVDQYAPPWREAKSAVGAPQILQTAAETATLGEAVAACTLVIGTGCLTYRKPEQPVVELPDLAPLVARELSGGGRVAMVFGPEKHGLSREDLALCHCMTVIPTDAGQPSMNLGQAVAVCLYELAVRAGLPPADSQGNKHDCSTPYSPDGATEGEKLPAKSTSGNLDILTGLVEETMQAAGYSPRSMQAANRHDLHVMLRRMALTAQDSRRILGLFRRILWRLQRRTPQS
jgi:tRNA/rRNA methyltransferase